MTQAEWDREARLAKGWRSLGFSVRVSNTLAALNIETVDDLCLKAERDLLRERNFSEGSLREVNARLANLGRYLGDENDSEDDRLDWLYEEQDRHLDAIDNIKAQITRIERGE